MDILLACLKIDIFFFYKKENLNFLIRHLSYQKLKTFFTKKFRTNFVGYQLTTLAMNF